MSYPRETVKESATPRAAAPFAAKTRGAYETLSMSSVGLEMGLSVLIGLFLGRWLDGLAGTDPLLMIAFLIFGFAAGVRGLVVGLRKSDRQAARDARELAAAGETP